jgi:hypothetical protein
MKTSDFTLGTHRRLTGGRIPLIGFLLLLLGGATIARANGEVERKDNLQVVVSGKLSPHRLPRQGSAPVSVSVQGKISTLDGSNPPQLERLTIAINRHGHFETRGLPICRIGEIQPASNARALQACRSALVGKGKFFGTISLPGQAPYPIEGELLVFNGREGSHQVLLGHIYSPHPFATSFVISFEIKHSGHGVFGTTLVANLNRALGKKRNLTGIEMTLSRRYSSSGARRSYISAGCPAPKGFPSIHYPLAKTSFTFAGNTTLQATLTRSCGVR